MAITWVRDTAQSSGAQRQKKTPAVSQRPPTGAGSGSSPATPANGLAAAEAHLHRISTIKCNNALILSDPGNASDALRARSGIEDLLEVIVEKVKVLSPTYQAGSTIDTPNPHL